MARPIAPVIKCRPGRRVPRRRPFDIENTAMLGLRVIETEITSCASPPRQARGAR